MTGAFDLGDGGDGQSMPGCLDRQCDPTIPVLQNESAAFGVPPRRSAWLQECATDGRGGVRPPRIALHGPSEQRKFM
jgi:hypothetical protein